MSELPRVLVACFAPFPGTNPQSASILAMASALRAELDVVTVKTERLSHIEQMGNARIFRVPLGDGSSAERREAFDRAIARQLEAERYDIVHAFGPFEGVVASIRKEELGFRLVYEMSSFVDESLGLGAERVWRDFNEQCLQKADLVIVSTEAARRSVLERNPQLPVKALRPAVDFGSLDWCERPTHARIHILYLGSFSSDRDLPTVLGALRRLRFHLSPLPRVLFAGENDPERQSRLREMVDAFGLSSIVEVRGEPLPGTLAKVVSWADICLAPAGATARFQEFGDLPQPLLEYMACKRPVIAAAVPAMSEVLRDGEEGLLYAPEDDESLASAVVELVRSSELRSRLAEAAYQRVRRDFSIGARKREIAAAYAPWVRGIEDPWRECFEESEEPLIDEETILAAEAALLGEVPGERTGEVEAAPEIEGGNTGESFAGPVLQEVTEAGSQLVPEEERTSEFDIGQIESSKGEPFSKKSQER
ncbi:MAG: glycosyltransferase family 4 protein [Deltaproteobacteria bacterium]|nr:glycosyltransferase family 4 protein [Deltaproteobacteria bacterium]